MGTSADIVLKVDGLALNRGFRRLFADLSFQLARGDLLLLRGANGTGKSSLLRVLAGFLPPGAGSALWTGSAPAPRYLGHHDGLKGPLTVRENLAFLAKLYGLDPSANIASLGLKPLMDLSVSDLSAGQRRRTALSLMVAGDGTPWLMDEPATSLDDAGKAWLWDRIAAHRAAGGAVIAAVHEREAPEDARVLTLGRTTSGELT